MTMLKIKDISLKLGQFELNRVNFEVPRGGYFVLLGVSGSGKSVLLRIIAGLITGASGQVFLGGKDISREKVQRRKVGLVFQDAALFPHMNVFKNIAYPLRSAQLKNGEIEKRVNELAGVTGVSHLLKRSTANLSGGEAQRVALARALALSPQCLLLDEPLSSLDAQLRGELRSLLRELNRRGQTIVHVTHDYEEAVLLAGRIGVIEHGTVVQQGSPTEVFLHPRSEFMARFVGIRNFFSGTLSGEPGSSRNFHTGGITFTLLSDEPPGQGCIAIRGEDVTISKNMTTTSAVNNFRGAVTSLGPARMGTEVMIDIGIPLGVLISDESAASLELSEGKTVWVSCKASALKFIGK
jgi:molybdate/tungstate transport system ATP-binding protein